jgi:hypothetical protein
MKHLKNTSCTEMALSNAIDAEIINTAFSVWEVYLKQEARGPYRSPESYWLLFPI